MKGRGSFANMPIPEPYVGLHDRTFERGATVNTHVFEPGRASRFTGTLRRRSP
jgi:hypothetical protein